ncbi:MAG TPA: hypothetical protein VGG64_17250 [Pirellulales bacterium]|jgi:hypothetical protein
MTQSPTTRRRWFQFGLSTLFVLVTVLAVWLGWELHIVRERQAIRQRIAESGGRVYPSEQSESKLLLTSLGMVTECRIPVWREWLGDEPVGFVRLKTSASYAELKKARLAFPEAQFCARMDH